MKTTDAEYLDLDLCFMYQDSLPSRALLGSESVGIRR